MGAVLLAAALLAGPAIAGPAPAPAPGELWSEFPLEPRTETRPAGPESEQGTTRPVDSSQEPSPPWVLLGLAAAAAAATTAVLYDRRRASQPIDASGPEDAYPPGWPLSQGHEQAGQERGRSAFVAPSGRANPGATARDRLAVVVAEASVGERAPRTDPPLVEVLSPNVRPDERVEEHETELEASGLEVCEIRLWHGYVKSLFYAEVDPPLKRPVQSRPFRARGGDAPERSDQAVAAYGALVEELLAAGWEPDGRGAHWFSDRFRRG